MRLGFVTAHWQGGDRASVEQIGARTVLHLGACTVTFDSLGALERALDEAAHDLAQHKAQAAHEAAQT